MSKKEISWIGLIKVLIAEKKAGEPAGVKDVMDVAKQEWVEIKAGKHAKYIKGKQVITRRKKSKSKSKSKTAKKRCDDEEDPATEMAAIVDKCKLCKKCMKEIKKHIK
jgi:hypothetical protein